MIELKDLRRKNFEPKNFWYSKTAEKNNISNVPPQSALVGLMKLADTLQFIRDKIDIPLIISNAYRSHQLNRLIKACYRDWETDRKSTRLNSSHLKLSRMPSSA